MKKEVVTIEVAEEEIKREFEDFKAEQIKKGQKEFFAIFSESTRGVVFAIFCRTQN